MKDVKWAWSFFDEKSDFTGSRLFPWVKEYVLNISKIECSQFRIKKFLLEGEKKLKENLHWISYYKNMWDFEKF